MLPPRRFRRIANLYFLFISILMFVGTYFPAVFASPLSPWTTLGPLIIVLAISMVKEAYEDAKRGASDREVNGTSVDRLSPEAGFETLKWADVVVGDVVLIRGGDPVPADVVLLQTSKPDGSCYVETSNIDGETDLKTKEAVLAIAAANPSEMCGKHGDSEPKEPTAAQMARIQGIRGSVECQAPNDKLYKFEGALTVDRDDEAPASASASSSSSRRAAAGASSGSTGDRLDGTHPLSYGSMLLRGCTLRNTAWALGAVMYTGRESKVMMKSGGGRTKLSATEVTVNASVLVIFACQVLLCVITTVASAVWDAQNLEGTEVYLSDLTDAYVIPGWLGDFFTFLILFNNFIPISLYVTVEMVNYAQAALVDVDPDMRDPETNTFAKARTSNLNQDLGQVEFVFSDKTGTLTRNVMEFKACSIAGRAFGTVPALGGEWDDSAATAVSQAAERHQAHSKGRSSRATGHGGASTPRRSGGEGPASTPRSAEPASSRGRRAATQTNPLSTAGEGRGAGSRNGHSGRGASSSVGRGEGSSRGMDRSHRERSATATGVGSPLGPGAGVFFDAEMSSAMSGDGEDAKAIDVFVTVMAVCHTVVPEEVEGDDDAEMPTIEYQAESPDEGALVKAARCLGYKLATRSAKGVSIQMAVAPESAEEAEDQIEGGVSIRGGTPRAAGAAGAASPSPRRPKSVMFRRLGTHKFSSARKRMSVVVLDPRDPRCEGDADGEGGSKPEGAWLLVKGADNKMIDVADPRASATSRRSMDVLQEHLTAFAERGLRTLVLGRRWMPWSEVEKWQAGMEKAERTVGGKDKALEELAETYEKDLEIVGATAIEDKLQEGVPQTIADLARAGIKTWVLTGDKVETAINIGRTCKLLTDDMGEPLRVTAASRDEALEQLRAANASLDRYEAEGDGDGDGDGQASRSGGRAAVKVTSVEKAAPSWGEPSPGLPGAGGPCGSCGTDLSRRPRSCLGAFCCRAWDALRLGASWNCGDGGVVRDPSATAPKRLPRCLVITGPALDFVIRRGVDPKTRRRVEPDKEMETELLTAAQRCQAVIACRVSPKQKADIVALVRHSRSPQPMTLAIGDGANDVGMIQKAQVGVGISGKEGLQAVNSADFAIAQFRFLKRLLLVHGRWNYRRMAKVLLYSFYKNVVITCTLFAYNAAAGFSGTSFYESLVYSTYNFVLGWPIVIVGILDQDMGQDEVMQHPSVYASGLRNLHLNVPKLTLWILLGFVHGALVYGASVLPFSLGDGPVWDPVSGLNDGHAVAGLSAFAAMCWAMQAKVSLITQHWTWVNWLALFVSQAGFFLFIGVYQSMTTFAPEFAGVATNALGRPAFWLSSILATAVIVVFDVVIETVRLSACPTFIDVASERAGGILWKDDRPERPWGDEGDLHAGGSAHARELSEARGKSSGTQQARARQVMHPRSSRSDLDSRSTPAPAGETPDKAARG